MNFVLGPLISEKSMNDVSKNKYTFKVSQKADKISLKKEIEKKFNVNVLNISTITTKGRSAIAGARRVRVFKEPFKKAIVTVKPGQKISLFEATGAK